MHHISPISPHISPLYLPYISPISPLYLPHPALEQATGACADARAELQAAQEAAEAQEARRRADRTGRIASGEIDRALRLDELTAPMLQQAIARLALAKGVAGVDKVGGWGVA